MSMGLVLGLCTLYYLYRTPRTASLRHSSSKSAKFESLPAYKEARRSDVDTAALFASLYWITQVSAFLYPGSLGLDPPGSADWFAGPQVYVSGVALGMVAVGWRLETAALA